MKKLLALACLLFSSLAYGQVTTNSSVTGISQGLQVISGTGLSYFQGPTPAFLTMGDGLVASAGAIVVNSPDWNATSGAASILNKPTIQAIQRIRAQTDTSGVYTWTFPVAYGAGVVPVVSAVAEGTNASIWNAQITSSSNTSAVIQVNRSTTAVQVLGINVLSLQSNPQTFVDLQAVAP